MWKFVAVVALAACNQRAAGPRLEWAPDEATAFARARAEHRGVIAEVYASWAMQSVEMDRALHRADVAARLGAWVAYRDDVSDGDGDPAKPIPFVGFYSADGTELQHASSPDDVLARAATFRTGTPSSR